MFATAIVPNKTRADEVQQVGFQLFSASIITYAEPRLQSPALLLATLIQSD